MDETPGKQHHDEHDQAGAEDAAQPVGKLFRPQRHQKGRCKKQHRVGQLQPGTAAYQRHQHLEGGTGGAGDGKAGPDGKIHQNGEHHGEHRMHPAGKLIQTACPCHSHHARNGQADGADGKARKGRPEAGTGLCAQMRREDQIACTKKHGKQCKADQKQIFAGKLLHRTDTSFLSCIKDDRDLYSSVYRFIDFMSRKKNMKKSNDRHDKLLCIMMHGSLAFGKRCGMILIRSAERRPFQTVRSRKEP